jgi:REP element-mobilizing transposase RayT
MKKKGSPEGRKTVVAHIWQHSATSDLQYPGRRPLIKPEFRGALFAYLGGIVREMQGTVLIVNGTAEHVHMLVRARPIQSPAEIARVVKTNSSRWLHEKVEFKFCLADRLWGVQRQRIECRRRHKLHRHAGGTP